MLNADFSIQSTYPPDKNNQFPRFHRAQYTVCTRTVRKMVAGVEFPVFPANSQIPASG
jgi:hypothetical protein